MIICNGCSYGSPRRSDSNRNNILINGESNISENSQYVVYCKMFKSTDIFSTIFHQRSISVKNSPSKTILVQMLPYR